MSDTMAGTEVEIFEALDFEASPPSCDYTDCEEKATHMLVCGACYMGREFMCKAHTLYTAAIKREQPEELVTFDNTCKHNPEFGNCPIEPLAE